MHIGWFEVVTVIFVALLYRLSFQHENSNRELKDKLNNLERDQKSLAERMECIEHDVARLSKKSREKDETLEEQWLKGKLPS